MNRKENYLSITAWLAAILLLTYACNDNLDIRRDYRFNLETMPVQKRIRENETAEIRSAPVVE